jgi:serine/threonine protein kinase
MPDLCGQDIGRYHLEEKLGEGGMAVVYKAYDPQLKRFVALKMIHPDQADNTTFIKRFEQEVKILAGLSHPNIIGVIDYGEQAGAYYLVMEYMGGGTLNTRLGTALDYKTSAALLAPIARALAYAHCQKVVHRDIKPSNILFNEDGAPMLSDFGIARLLESEEKTALTATIERMGTADYMAPEQANSKEITPAVDIYALGSLYYELVTGRRPYQGDTPFAIMMKKEKEPPARPAGLIKGLPIGVEYVIYKALERDPRNRFADMDRFAAALEKLAKGEQEVGIKVRLPSEGKAWQKWVFGGGGALVVVALLLLGLQLRDSKSQSSDRVSELPAALGSGSATPLSTTTATQMATPTASNTPTATPFQAVLEKTPLVMPGEIISPENVKEVVELARWGGQRNINDMELSSDGKLLVAAAPLGIAIYDVDTGKLQRWIDTEDWMWRISISPDSSLLATWSQKGDVQLWQTSDGILLRSLGNIGERVAREIDPSTIGNFFYQPFNPSLTFSPDNKMLAAALENGGIRLWSVADGSLIKDYSGKPQNITDIKFSPYGDILATKLFDGTVELLQAPDLKLIRSFSNPPQQNPGWSMASSVYEERNGIAFSPNGQLIAARLIKTFNTATGIKNMVSIWNVQTGNLVRSIDTKGGGLLSLSANGEFIVADGQVFQTSDGAHLYDLDYPGTGLITFAPDGQNAILAEDSGIIRKVKIGNDKSDLLSQVELEGNPVGQGLAFSADSGQLISYPPLLSWRVADGSVLFAPQEGKNTDTAGLTPDGKNIIASSMVDDYGKSNCTEPDNGFGWYVINQWSLTDCLLPALWCGNNFS